MRALPWIGMFAAAATISAAPQPEGAQFMIEPGAQVVEVTLATHPVCSVLVFGGSPDITIERLVTPEGIDMTFASGHYTPQRTTRLFRGAPLPGVSSAATLNLVNHSEATRTLSIISLPGCYFGR